MSQWLPLLGYIGAILVVIWKGGQWAGKIEAKLDLILSNHLPHLQDGLDRVEERVARLEK